MLEQEIAKIESFKAPEFKIISSKSLVSDRKHSKLLDQEISVKVDSQNGKDFEFDQPIYVDCLEFHSVNDDDSVTIELEVKYLDGSTETFKELEPIEEGKKSSVFVYIENFIKSFQIKSAKWFGKSSYIKKIVVEGHDIKSFDTIAQEFETFRVNVAKFKEAAAAERAKTAAERTQLENEKTEFSNKKDGLQSDIDSINSELSELENQKKNIGF